MKIDGHLNIKEDITEKRFYVPGAKVKKKCTCGKTLIRDLGEDYLDYEERETLEIYLSCDDCENDYYLKYKAEIIVRINYEV